MKLMKTFWCISSEHLGKAQTFLGKLENYWILRKCFFPKVLTFRISFETNPKLKQIFLLFNAFLIFCSKVVHVFTHISNLQWNKKIVFLVRFLKVQCLIYPQSFFRMLSIPYVYFLIWYDYFFWLGPIGFQRKMLFSKNFQFIEKVEIAIVEIKDPSSVIELSWNSVQDIAG